MSVGGAPRGTIAIGVLGDLRVTVDGQPIALGGPKQRSVLLRLVLSVPNAVSSDRLLDDLWPDGPPPTADGTLQAYVSRLRALIGRERIERDGGGYRLRVPAEAIDLRRFESELERGRDLVGAGRDREAVDALDVALALWRSDPAIEWSDLPSATPELTVLTEARIEAIRLRAEAALRLDDSPTAIRLLESAVDHHPFHEGLWVLLASALDREARHREAGAVLDRAVDRLEAEAWQPGPQLVEALARHDRTAGVDDSASTSELALVGRKNDIAAVVEALRSARALTVVGPGGVGKTRLASEVTACLLRDGIVDSIVQVDLADLGAQGDPVEAVAGRLGAVRSSGSSTSEVVADHLARRRLALVLDTCELLADLVAPLVTEICARTGASRVIATSRAPLGSACEIVHVLQPLTPPASDTLGELETNPATALLTAAANRAFAGFRVTQANAAAVASIVRRLGGLPLALGVAGAHLATTTPQRLAARLSEGFPGWMADDGADDVRHATLRATLDWSFEAMPHLTQRALLAASSFAGPFTGAAVASVLGGGRPAAAIEAELSRLVDRSVLERVATESGPRYAFHSLVAAYARERVAAGPDRDEFVARHQAFVSEVVERGLAELRGARELGGVRLLRSWSADVDAVLDRLTDAGEFDAAAELTAGLVWWWYLDGRLAAGAARIERLREAAPDEPMGPAWAETLAGHGMLLTELDPASRAGPGRACEGLALARRSADSRVEAVAVMALADALTWAGPLLDAPPLLDEAERRFEQLECAWGLGWARSRRLRVMPAMGGTADDARRQVARARMALEEAGDRRALGYLHLIATNIERLDGRPAVAFAEASAGAAVFRSFGDPVQLVKALRCSVLAAVELEDELAAADAVADFGHVVHEHPIPHWTMQLRWCEAEWHLLGERPASALAAAEDAVRLVDLLGAVPELVSVRAVLVRALIAEGRFAEADERARTDLARAAEAPGSGFTRGEAHWTMAKAALASGDRRRFVRWCRRAIDAYLEVGSTFQVSLILSDLASAQHEVDRVGLAARLTARAAELHRLEGSDSVVAGAGPGA